MAGRLVLLLLHRSRSRSIITNWVGKGQLSYTMSPGMSFHDIYQLLVDIFLQQFWFRGSQEPVNLKLGPLCRCSSTLFHPHLLILSANDRTRIAKFLPAPSQCILRG